MVLYAATRPSACRDTRAPPTSTATWPATAHPSYPYLLAWSRDDASQEAAARALTGEIPITGRLPIDLPAGGYSVGDGVLVPGQPWIMRGPVR